MTVAVQALPITYNGNGTASPLAVPFRFLANDHLVVTRIAADGTRSVLVRGTHYSVAGAGPGPGGTVTPLAAIAVGDKWEIDRATPREQPTKYPTGDDFPAATHELALDRSMMVAQEIDARAAALAARTPLALPGQNAPGFDVAGLAEDDLLVFKGGRLRRFNSAPFSAKFYAGAALTGKLIPAEGTGGGDLALRGDLADEDAGLQLAAFKQSGTGAIGRNAAEKVAEFLTTSDFSSLQAAADQATSQRAAIALPRGNYATTGITIDGYSLSGLGAKLTRASGSNPIITVASNLEGLQTTRAVVLNDIEIDAVLAGVRTGIGVRIQNSAIFEMNSVRVRGASVGMLLDRCQFAPIRNAKLYDNDVGMVLRPSVDAGGANSITLDHPVMVGNKIGLAIDNSANVFGQGDIVLINPQMLVNTVCAMAAIGISSVFRTSAITVVGSGPEANAGGADATFTYNGNVIPKCCYYLKYADVHALGVSFSEYSTVNPVNILIGATLTLTNCTGYSNPEGFFVDGDRDSSVIIQGEYAVNGTVHCVTSFTGHLSSTSPFGAIVGPRREIINHSIGNLFTTPDVPPYLPVGVTSSAIAYDSRGKLLSVQFAAAVGDANLHCLRIAAGGLSGGTGGRVVVRLELLSTTDTQLRIAFFPNEAPRRIQLRANEPTTVICWGTNISNASSLLVIQPIAADAPLVQVRNFHGIAGQLDDPLFRAWTDLICAGHFNPSIPSLVPFPPQASAPTASQYPVGAFVPRSTVVSGETRGWSHAGGGTWVSVGNYA